MKKFLFRLETPLRFVVAKWTGRPKTWRGRGRKFCWCGVNWNAWRKNLHWAESKPVNAEGELDLGSGPSAMEYMDHLESLIEQKKELLVPLQRPGVCV
jgi:hypothetical protein